MRALLIATDVARHRRKGLNLSLSSGRRYFNVPESGGCVRPKTMTERICGALGCTNDADGEAWIGDVKIQTCLSCADDKGLKVRLYE